MGYMLLAQRAPTEEGRARETEQNTAECYRYIVPEPFIFYLVQGNILQVKLAYDGWTEPLFTVLLTSTACCWKVSEPCSEEGLEVFSIPMQRSDR